MKLFRFVSVFSLLLLFFTLTSCSKKAEEINYNSDECDYCKMQISDNRYGAELITDKGRVYKFDSIECLIEFSIVQNLIGDSNQKFLITDFATPESFIDATSAFYVHNDNFRSPMGLNVSAFDSEISRQKFVAENGGSLLNWSDVVQMVNKSNE